jgi:hypothetical protein
MARKDRDTPDGAKTPASFSTVDEQTKAKAKSSLATALEAAAKEAKAAEEAQAKENDYYTKVLASGKTQAQIDTLREAYDTAEIIRQNAPNRTSTVDRETGKVVTKTKVPTPVVEDIEEPDDKKGGRVVVSTYVDEATGDTYAVYSDGSRELLSAGTRRADESAAAAKEKLAEEREAKLIEEEKRADRKSAYDLLFSEFKQYGLEALVSPLKSLIEEGVSPSEFTLRLRETDAYKKRFAANAQRVAKGLRALSEAEYIGTEDQYQDVMRRYGMPESYYTKGELGIQTGFEKFLAGDVSAVELEDRIQTAQNRVVNSNPEVTKALKEFYPGISNGDILAYVLDPNNAIEQIKRKVTAAEIGGAAIQSGLQTGMTRAEELSAAGVTKQTAQQGFGTIAGGLQRGSQLASIYGEDPYSQAVAETEVFGLAGSEKARKQRQKITGLERATFGGQTGVTSSALSRDAAGSF